MTTPDGGPPAASAPGPQHAAPSVSTAPAGHGARWWSAVPTHLGRARTSTVILGVLFLAIGALYLNVHPTAATSPGTTTTGGGAPVAPAPAPAPVKPTRTRTSTAPAPSSARFTAPGNAPTSTQSTTSAPVPTTSSAPSSSSSPSAVPPVPTTSSAPTS